MGITIKFKNAFLYCGVAGMVWSGCGISASALDKIPSLPAKSVLNDLELRFEDAKSAEAIAGKRLASFERLLEKGSASPAEVKRAKANVAVASETRNNAEALLSFLENAPAAKADGAEDPEMFLALPGLSMQMGLIGFGHLRVLNKDETLDKTAELIRFDRSNPNSLEYIEAVRDFRGTDLAKLTGKFATDSELRTSNATLASLNRRVKDIAESTTGSPLLSKSKLTFSEMLNDQDSDPGAGYLATLFSWTATTDPMELEATKELCRVFADSTAEVEFARAVVELAELSAEARRAIEQRGSGSPIEVRIAEGKLGVAKAELRRAEENLEIWKAKESLVLSLIETPVESRESVSYPKTMKEAIARFEEIAESVDLAENDRLAQSGYSILLSQFDALVELARSGEACEMSSWKVAALEKSKAPAAEQHRAKLTLEKNEAYKRFQETLCEGLAAKLNQLAAIGNTISEAKRQGKSRDNFSLPHSEELASSLARLHEIKSKSLASKNREMEIRKFYEWKHSELLGLHKNDSDHIEVHRTAQKLEESRLMERQIDEALTLEKLQSRIADKMFSALSGNQPPLSVGDLAPEVRDSLFGYHAVQIQQDSEIQLAKLNLQIESEKRERVEAVRSKGLASVRELNSAKLREKIASIQVANSDRRNDEIHGLSQQMAAAFGVADASLTSTITEE